MEAGLAAFLGDHHVPRSGIDPVIRNDVKKRGHVMFSICLRVRRMVENGSWDIARGIHLAPYIEVLR